MHCSIAFLCTSLCPPFTRTHLTSVTIGVVMWQLMLRWVMKSVRGAVPILRREKLIHSAEAVAPKETIMGFTVE